MSICVRVSLGVGGLVLVLGSPMLAQEPASAVETILDPSTVQESALAADTTIDLDVIVVRCNDSTLTHGQLAGKVEARLQGLEGRVPAEQLKQLRPRLRDQVQEEFIMESLLKQAVAKENISASKEEVDGLLEQAEASLSAQNLSLEDALRMEGVGLEEFRSRMEFQICVQKLISTQTEKLSEVTDEEIVAHYEANQAGFNMPESVHARHILIGVDRDGGDEAKLAKREAIDTLRQKLIEGSDFGELAKENSSCPSSKKGGDLGTFGRNAMAPPFEEAAFSQAVGEVGQVVETRFGYHLIEVLEKVAEKSRNLDDVREEVVAKLEEQRKGRAFTEYFEALRDSATIEYPAVRGTPADL